MIENSATVIYVDSNNDLLGLISSLGVIIDLRQNVLTILQRRFIVLIWNYGRKVNFVAENAK